MNWNVTKNPWTYRFGHAFPCCFFRALSQIAGRKWICSPFGNEQLAVQTRTPKQLFFRILTLWLFVLRIAHPEICLRASSLVCRYTYRMWPSAHSQNSSNSCSANDGTCGSFMSQSRSLLLDPLPDDVFCIELLLCVIRMLVGWLEVVVNWLCKWDDCLDSAGDDDE